MATQLANDIFGRSVSVTTANGIDTYTVGNNLFTLEFPTGTQQAIAYAAINKMSSSMPTQTLQQIYTGVVQAAMAFGQQMVLQITVANLMAGITASGQTEAFIAYTANLALYLNSGYLYSAVDAINTMIADTSSAKTSLSPFLTNDLLYTYLNQLQTFLNLPLTINPGP